MCGLIAFIAKDEKVHPGNKIIDQYQDQHGRGNEGFGLLSIDNQEIRIQRATEPTKALLDAKFSGEPIQLFHHRRPTSTDNKLEQTHPIRVSHDELKFDYYVLHNGVISNDDDLYEKHTKELGYTYNTFESSSTYGGVGYHYTRNKFNDSESFAIELARYIEKLSKEIGTKGSAAFIALQVDKKTNKAQKILWGRNDLNPLDILKTDEGILIASSIYHNKAEEIKESTFQMLDLNKLARKKETTPIENFIKERQLKFFKPAPIVTKTAWSNKKDKEEKKDTKTTSTVSSKTIIEPPKTKNETNIDPDFEERTYGYSPRMKAFVKMSDRFMQKIWIDVENLFQDIAYDEMDETQLDYFLSDIKDMILEKEKEAEEKIRPFFDYQEEMQLNKIIDGEAEAEDKRKDEEIGINEQTIAEMNSLNMSDAEIDRAYEESWKSKYRKRDIMLPGGLHRFNSI